MTKVPKRELEASIRREIKEAASQRGHSRLKAEHRIGKIIEDLVPERSVYGRSTIRSLAEKVGLKPERLYHYREFATRYLRKDLDRLLRTAPKVTFSHVIALMSIEDRGEREEFETRLGGESLSVVDLRLVIQDRFKKRRSGGRNVSLGTPKSALRSLNVELARLTKRWNRRKRQIKAYLAKAPARLPRNTIEAFSKAAEEIGALVPETEDKSSGATRAST